MTLFELVKQNICVPDAAEHYELQVKSKWDAPVARSMRTGTPA